MKLPRLELLGEMLADTAFTDELLGLLRALVVMRGGVLVLLGLLNRLVPDAVGLISFASEAGAFTDVPLLLLLENRFRVTPPAFVLAAGVAVIVGVIPRVMVAALTVSEVFFLGKKVGLAREENGLITGVNVFLLEDNRPSSSFSSSLASSSFPSPIELSSTAEGDS